MTVREKNKLYAVTVHQVLRFCHGKKVYIEQYITLPYIQT